jgi:hypothetical protein
MNFSFVSNLPISMLSEDVRAMLLKLHPVERRDRIGLPQSQFSCVEQVRTGNLTGAVAGEHGVLIDLLHSTPLRNP